MLDGARALLRGFWTTLRHAAHPPITIPYPEERRPIPSNFRGRHRLYRRADGLERCIACELCAAACPSSAIFVEGADNDPQQPVSTGERYARTYEINMIRCIFCGYCEEACPVDAIKLGQEYELADFTRESFVYTKEMLLDPDRYAPRQQFHPEVDQPKGREFFNPPEVDLGEVYRRHRPLAPESEEHPSSRPD